MRRSRQLVVALAAGAMLSGSPVLGDSSDTRDERERVRTEAAAVAAALDPLLAEDAELEAAVVALTAEVDGQQARVDATRAAISTVEARQAQLANEIADTETERVGVRERVRELAVSEYVGSAANEVDSYWSAPDLNAASRQRGLFDNVTDTEVDAIDSLRALEADLAGLLAEEDATKSELADLEAERAERLTDLALALDEQERLQVALDARIAEFVAEADALADEEAALTELLQSQLTDEAAAAAPPAAPVGEPAPGPGDGGGGGEQVEPPRPAPANPGPALSWPASGTVTSRFGPRWGRMHQGIDIAAGSGTPVFAAAAGTVLQAGFNGGYGNMVVIDHGAGLSTVYAHHSSLTVSAGQQVGAGTEVGLMGSTGNSTGPHVHFEVRVNGTPYDPMAYLP